MVTFLYKLDTEESMTSHTLTHIHTTTIWLAFMQLKFGLVWFILLK